MTRFHPVDLGSVDRETRELLEALRDQYGTIPNSAAALANSPASLRCFLAFGGALTQGELSPSLRSLISIAVSQANGCTYCVAANCAIGKSIGLSDNEISDSRRGCSTHSRTDSALGFAISIVQNRGRVTEDDVTRVRRAGYSDSEAIEIVAVVAWNLFVNYFTHVAELDIDFPRPPDIVTP